MQTITYYKSVLLVVKPNSLTVCLISSNLVPIKFLHILGDHFIPISDNLFKAIIKIKGKITKKNKKQKL